MDLNKVYVCDIETTGFLDDIQSFEDLHVLSVCYPVGDKWHVKSTNNWDDIQKLLSNPDNTLVFHNGIMYDKPVLQKMGFDFKASIIDTLGLSYYLYPELDKHGLESWGEYFGVPKPKIEDWSSLSYEEYEHRCSEDTKINTRLWIQQLAYLRELYGDDAEVKRAINYINFKMYVLHKQDTNPLYIDIQKTQSNLEILEGIIKEKEEELNSIMPPVPIKTKRKRPKVLHKKDGSLSVAGAKWMNMVESCGLPQDYDGEIEEVVGYDEPNCQSTKQMKEFLLSKGWKPTIFKDGANGKVPQLRDDDKMLCPDIQRLIIDYPELQALDGLSVAQHRAGYLKGFLKHSDSGGRVKAWAHGFTKTLRLKHAAPMVNLPKVSAQYGEYVRSCIVAPKGYKVIGSDLSSIEDKTKQIELYPIDPDYVMSMNTKGWDAHLSLGLKAGMFTEQEVAFYKWYKNKDKEESDYTCPDIYIGLSDDSKSELFAELDRRRGIAKTGTYSLTYLCGVPKLMELTNLKRKGATNLHKGYWDLNWSVKKFAETRTVKAVNGINWVRLNKKVGGLKQVDSVNWIYNKFTGMWLYLKNDKDRFSAINQSNGVKVFDVWCYYLDDCGINISAQFHDELMFYIKEEYVDNAISYIKSSMEKVNKYFNPPIPLECDYKVGDNYGDVH